jgi:hypothetical protein
MRRKIRSFRDHEVLDVEGNFFKGALWAMVLCIPFWLIVIGLVIVLL